MSFWDGFLSNTISAMRSSSFPMFPSSWRKRSNSSNSPQQPSLPLGLRPAQIKAISDLALDPRWAAYREALEELYRLKGREALQGLAPEQYHNAVGYLRAIETAATLPDVLTTVMTRVAQDDERRQQDAGRAADRIFYGSPHWRGARADRVAGTPGRSAPVGTR